MSLRRLAKVRTCSLISSDRVNAAEREQWMSSIRGAQSALEESFAGS